MHNSISESKTCCCSTDDRSKNTINAPATKAKFSLKGIPSILLSIGIAFFPKCPICWAAYMSMFGSVGLANLPYMKWLFPVLFIFLGIHLYLLYKKSSTNGFLPFQLSLGGAVLMLIGKVVFPQATWLVFVGTSCIIVSSLLISFSSLRLAR